MAKSKYYECEHEEIVHIVVDNDNLIHKCTKCGVKFENLRLVIPQTG